MAKLVNESLYDWNCSLMVINLKLTEFMTFDKRGTSLTYSVYSRPDNFDPCITEQSIDGSTSLLIPSISTNWLRDDRKDNIKDSSYPLIP